MDWKRIKTFLIILLLFTNSILIFNLCAMTSPESYRNHDEIIRLYEVKNIRVEFPAKKFPDRAEGVVAELKSISAEDEFNIQRYFEGSSLEFNMAVLDDSLSFLWTGIVPGPLKRISQPEEGIDYLSLCKAFFDKIELDFDPVLLDYHMLGGIVVVRAYQGIPSFGSVIPEIESEVYLYFRSDRMVGVRIGKHIRLKSEIGGYDRLITMDDALYKALEFAVPGSVMNEVRLVYKLNDNSLLVTDLVRGEMSPYYEFRFEQHPPIFIRATQ